MTTIVYVIPLNNSKVHRNSLPSSPSSPDPHTRPRTRITVCRTLSVTFTVTILVGNPGLVTYDRNQYRRYPSIPVRSPDVHSIRPFTVDLPSSDDRSGFESRTSPHKSTVIKIWTDPLGDRGPNTRYLVTTLSVSTRPVRTGVRGFIRDGSSRYHPFLESDDILRVYTSPSSVRWWNGDHSHHGGKHHRQIRLSTPYVRGERVRRVTTRTGWTTRKGWGVPLSGTEPVRSRGPCPRTRNQYGVGSNTIGHRWEWSRVHRCQV